MIYQSIDFLKSRLGQMLILSALAIAVIGGVGAYHHRRQQAQLVSDSFPLASSHPLWDKGKTIRIEGRDVYGHAEANPTFEPFTPANERIVDDVLPMRAPQSETARLGSLFTPMPSLIASERRASQPIELPEAGTEIVSLGFEPGALLHCRLTAPVSSEQGDAPVLAELTRPLVRGGEVVLPIGTRLVGSLRNASSDNLHFAETWQVELPGRKWIAVKAHAQQKGFDEVTGRYSESDGRAGLPAERKNPPSSKSARWPRLLGTFASAATRVAQDRTRTAIGDQIDSSARNMLLEGGAEVAEGWISESEPGNAAGFTIEGARYVIPAGLGFYLLTSPV